MSSKKSAKIIYYVFRSWRNEIWFFIVCTHTHIHLNKISKIHRFIILRKCIIQLLTKKGKRDLKKIFVQEGINKRMFL